jgi:hypothetical protein
MSGISWHFAHPFWLFWVFWLPATVLIWYTYATTRPAPSPPVRWFLFLLRTTALTLMLLLLWNPVLKFRREKVVPPRLAVLVDASQSMTFPPAKEDSLQQALERLKAALPVDVHWFYWGDSLLGPPAETLPNKPSRYAPWTDLATALRGIEELRIKENYQGIVLLSDGVVTRGDSPVETARNLRIPIFPYVIGDTLAPRDARLVDLSLPREVAVGETTAVQVTIGADAMAGERARLILTLDGRPVAESRLLLPEERFLLHRELTFAAPDTGIFKLTASLLTDGGEEITTNNNRLARYLRVIREHQTVRIVAGAPSFDLEMLEFLLGSDPHLTLETWLLTPGFRLPPAPSPADLLVLLDFPLRRTPPQILEVVKTDLEKSAVLWIPGPDIQWNYLEQQSELSGKPVLNRKVQALPARLHPAFGGESDLQYLRSRWRDLPPVFGMLRKIAAPASARSLLTDPEGDTLLLVREDPGRRRTGWLLVRDFWRWHFLFQGVEPGNTLCEDFLKNLTHWLGRSTGGERFTVSPAERIFPQQQPVQFTARLQDDGGTPITGARILVKIKGDSLETEFQLREQSHGLYSGNFGLLPPGNYHYSAEAQKGDLVFRQGGGRFSVETFNAEFLTPTADRDRLQRLAAVAGGRILNSCPDSSWFGDLEFFNTLRTTERETELRNKWYLFLVIVVLLGGEWFLRKYFHLL